MPFTELTESFNFMLSGIYKDNDLDDRVKERLGAQRCDELKQAIEEYNKSYEIAKSYESLFGKEFRSSLNDLRKMSIGVVNFFTWIINLKFENGDKNLEWMNARKNVYKSMDKVLELIR